MWSEVVYLHSENSCFSTTKMETIPEKTKKSGENPRSIIFQYKYHHFISGLYNRKKHPRLLFSTIFVAIVVSKAII